ncbi:hypothetical protein B2J86_15635 [Acidovorax sp. SRB_14]|nr:hypothetical protein [Acidovorax sp. SRB_24]NMM82343.1 hypothetical protein [Acidovorax sp. SRB_14]
MRMALWSEKPVAPMSLPALPQGTGSAAGAHLLIHTGAAVAEGWSLEALLQRMRARVLPQPCPERTRLALEIHDQRGHSVLALDLAGSLVDVALQPGTYRVTARRGNTRRSYTVALSPGSSFDLHVRLPHPGH